MFLVLGHTGSTGVEPREILGLISSLSAGRTWRVAPDLLFELIEFGVYAGVCLYPCFLGLSWRGQ